MKNNNRTDAKFCVSIPALRFPEFSDEWERKKLGDVAEINPSNKSLPDIFIYIDLERVINGELTKEDTIIRNDVYVASTGYAQIRTKQNPKYLYQYLHFQKFVNKVIESCTGTSYPAINSTDLSNILISLSYLPEQTRIATFLTAVDDKLTQLKQKKTLLEQYKKGVMQKIFSQEIRFKADNGEEFPEWDMKKLVEIGTFFSEGTPLTTKRQYFNGEIPFIRSGEINSDKTEQYITELGLKNSSAKMVEVGDLIYALYGATSGEVAISKIKGAINQAILCIRTSVRNRFLYYYLFLKKEIIIKTYLQGGQGNLSADIIKSIKVPIPSKEEQTKIGSFLSASDDKINHSSNQIEKTEQWKKGLLQKMFV